jgi:hypothetical protein
MDSAVLGLAALGCHCGKALVSTMDSAVLGLAALGCHCGKVLVFEQTLALEAAIGSHACSVEVGMHVAMPCLSVEVGMHVANGIPLSRGHFSYRRHHTLRRNTKGRADRM